VAPALIGEPGQTMQGFVDGLLADPFPPEVIGYLGRGESDGGAPKHLGPGTAAHGPARRGGGRVVVLAQLSPRRAGWVVQVCADLGLSASIPLPWRRCSPGPARRIGRRRALPVLRPVHAQSGANGVKQVLDLVLASAAVIVLARSSSASALAIACSMAVPWSSRRCASACTAGASAC